MVLNLDPVLEILNDATRAAQALQGEAADDTTVDRKAREAGLNRRLLNLSDQLDLASSLTRNEYWNGKGLLSYEL